MRLALALAIVVALGSTARAGDDVGVVVDGKGSLPPQLSAQIETWLSSHGHTVVASPFPPDAIAKFLDCFLDDNRGCARTAVETSAKSTSVVYARVVTESNASTGAREVTLTAYWLVKGHDPVVQKTTCAKCTDESVRAAADEVMRKLLGGGAAGHVKLKSSPPGARITIDGQPIGITPLDWDLPTGKHSIQMDKAGFKTASNDVVIAPDKSELLVMTLEPADDGGSNGRRSRVLPITVIAAGGALLIAGGVMIAIDEDPGPAAPPKIYDTAGLGIGLAVGGALVTGIGTYLLLRSPKTSSTPVAAFIGDSGYIGWLGRF